jgi:SAM-dependent methyltransferase
VLTTVEDRARASLGSSADAIYRMVAGVVRTRHPRGGIVLDVGCGRGHLLPHLRGMFEEYVGADVVRYDDFPCHATFLHVNLDTGHVPATDGFADVVTAVETVEHLENPRAFCRELTRLARRGGWVVVTAPNQTSVLAKLGLVLLNEFPAFRGRNYPASITALLEIDLRRIAAECGWADVAVGYSGRGRVPGTSRHWPRWLSAAFPRAFSDNLWITGRRS